MDADPGIHPGEAGALDRGGIERPAARVHEGTGYEGEGVLPSLEAPTDGTGTGLKDFENALDDDK